MNLTEIHQSIQPVDDALRDVSIGYKRSDIGVIPQDWSVERVSSVADVKTGPFGSTLHERDYVDDGTPIITVEHLSEHGIIHQNLPLVSDEDRSRLKSYRLRAGDIVFSRVGSVDRNALVSEEEDGWLFSGRLLRVRTSGNATYPPYLSYHFHSEPFKRQVYGVAVGQTMASINTQILKEVCVVLPTIPEQRAIAEALTDVDRLLRALKALIAKKRAIKQAAMQQLLTGKTRFPGFTAKWEATRMGRIGSTYGGLSGKSKSDFGIGEARYVTFLNILENVVLNDEQFDNVRVAPRESQNRVLKGDLLFNGTSETPEDLAMAAVLGEPEEDLYLNSFCFGFHIHDQSEYHPLFLAHFFRGIPGRGIMYALAQGATRYNMSKGQFLALELSIPSVEEQAVIAAVLSDMDAEIAALERRREKTRTIKRGMMQQLLTGRVRLVGFSGNK